MLFNLGGYLLGAGLILFAFWNLVIMSQGFKKKDYAERKKFMKKENIEKENKLLKPTRYIGYTLMIAGLIIYFLGYLI